MLLLVIFGFGMLGFGLFMAIRPLQFSKGIAQYSEKSWFHSFEITSRLIVGIIFLVLSKETPSPTLFILLGGILCLVSVFLIIIGPSRHKRFALLTSGIGQRFRALGFVAIFCGAGLVYVGLS